MVRLSRKSFTSSLSLQVASAIENVFLEAYIQPINPQLSHIRGPSGNPIYANGFVRIVECAVLENEYGGGESLWVSLSGDMAR